MPANEIILFILFNLFILALLLLDLGILHRTPRAVTIREAAAWTIAWIILALLFNLGVFWVAGTTKGLEFLTGYLIERALSMDNIFVFLVIFTYFGVPSRYQHRVLFWGVLGALVLRSVFIILGAALVARFEWILYIFGVILIVSGWKMFSKTEPEVHPERNVIIRFMKKIFPVTTDYDSPRFVLRRHGKTFITPLFIVLITVETTDVVFAVDSIPAVFGVTRDPFIVYSSNVFAILGLRAFYFLLAGVMNTFYYLSHGLSLVLIFIGAKMLLEPFSVHISITLSLLIVTGILTISIVASLIRVRRERRKKDAPTA